MAISMRRGVHNLTTISNAMSPWSSSVHTFRNNNCCSNKNNFWLSSSSQIPRFSFSISNVFDGSILCTGSKYRSKEISKLNCRNGRIDFVRFGKRTPKLHERKGQDKHTAKTKPLVVTREGTLDISLESSLDQVAGDLEQESEEASADSFPRGTYQSPRAVAPPVQPAPTVPVPVPEVGIGVGMGALSELEDALGFPLSQEPQCPCPKPLVIVVSGPSGVGKDAVIKGLQHVRRDIHFVVTATTRAMRPGEVDGVDYYFMSKTEFQEMIENHELLEHAVVYGDYKGIPKQQVREFMSQGMDVVLRVDVQGAATVRSILGTEAVFIFLVAESEVSLVKRLMERKTETMDKMLIRVATARDELGRMEEFDYVVVNQQGCLDRTISVICSIIDAEKARVKPKVAEI